MVTTSPDPSATSSVPPLTIRKRIIVCCDGTWQDGVLRNYPWQCTNILKISRVIEHQDHTHNPPIPQIVFYQSGVGSEKNVYSEIWQGGTGSSLSDKVQEAYAFIAHNYREGDEIFLFGFSRGAYTARTVAGFIGEIGVLDRQDMDDFANIFVACQKRGNASNETERKCQEEELLKYSDVMAKGRARADPDSDGFTIKCLGVFETVGSVGLPSEITLDKSSRQLFGFPNKDLGHHIQHAFQAIALNEIRNDFEVTKFHQTADGRKKGQVLKQVWFPGSHADVGGGWRCHDLSDISLAWMVSNIAPMLQLDHRYFNRLPDPIAPWGVQIPHDPAHGIFHLATKSPRRVPTQTDEETHEYIHPSALAQKINIPEVAQSVRANPALLWELTDMEKQFKDNWPYVTDKGFDEFVEKEAVSQESMLKMLEKMQAKANKKFGKPDVTVVDEKGETTYRKSSSRLSSIWHRLTE